MPASRSIAVDSKAQRGFGSIEMLLVFTLLGMAIVPLASIQLRAHRQISDSMRQSQANELALAQIERLRAGGFATAAADSGHTGPFRWSIAVRPDGENPCLQELQVRVDWVDDGEMRSLRVASKQARR